MRLRFLLRRLSIVLLALPVAPFGQAASYEAPLPAQLSTDPDLCAYAPCRDVLPGAESFSRRMGRPAYVEGYKTVAGQREVAGYVFLSTDIVDIPAYSGKPVVTLIGMDAKGIITGVRILRHSEPILLVGIPESQLTKFVLQYVGKFVGDKIEIGKAREAGGYLGIDAISGATVTVISENQVILRSGYAVARQVGLIKAVPKPPAVFTPVSGRLDWDALVREGSVARLTVRPSDVGAEDTGEPYIDLYFGYLNVPAIGRSILGDEDYRRLMADLKSGEHAIFVVSNGTASFKGSGFVRGGIFDRIQVAQDADTFTFRDTDYLNLYGVRAQGAPAYKESGIFILRNGNFSAAYPWSLIYLASKLDRQTGAKTFASFDREYWLPARYLEGGRPPVERPAPTWVKVWESHPIETLLFVLFLAAGGALYAARDALVRRARRTDKRWVSLPKYALWIASVGFVGSHLLAQPSITQVLTWFHSILFKWQWELFLSDPYIFVFWWFIIITVFFWGRGMFCGWLCPYGALTEVAYRVAGALGLKRFQFQLPQALHDKLKWVKYGVFAGLLGASFYSMGLAERLAEVEPFKTTFLVGVWNRSWPFVAYWTVLFAAALFIERPFCKYLCPLGASLAVPSTFRWWGLKRKQECGACRACEVGCSSLAIDRSGRIDQRECLLCLDCMVLYYDTHACPPLAAERKRRAKAGEPLTAIGANGYYVPLGPVPAAAVPAAEPRPGLLALLRTEIVDHLIPWSGKFWGRPRTLQAAGIALGVLVTWAWLLGAAGKLGAGIILGWWLAWSVYEVFARMACKPYVKEGPWWGRKLRPAGWADMVSYVAMKNLLIGAGLFLVMKALGALSFLQGLPELKWLY
jgi:NosR/NirI family nitrous oxide reductase transcriptional regulator